MILTPNPLQSPTLRASAQRTVVPVRQAHATPARPVLQTTLRVPQQLCLDLQPRPR